MENSKRICFFISELKGLNDTAFTQLVTVSNKQLVLMNSSMLVFITSATLLKILKQKLFY